MRLSLIDIGIIVLYLVAVAAIGLIMKNRAKANKEAYLLGGNTLPWYALGLSNASGMFDISGTMWMVMLAFVYGLKSIWIPWLWPSFNQVFLMMFLAAWLRRSNVTTGAEWMLTRFGTGKGSNKAHSIVVIFALLSCLGFLAYGFIGLGKFVEIFVPWSFVQPYMPFDIPAEFVPHFYGLILTSFAVFYSIMGGMASIVWADVLQYIIMTLAAVIIGVLAVNNLQVAQLNVPEEWKTPFFGATLNMDWTGIIDEVNDKIDQDGYSLFGIFFSMMLFKGILASLAGPAPNYDMQKILSSRSPKDAAKMSGFVSLVLIPTRYLMIIGFAVLALLNYNQLNLESASGIDFERILPAAIQNFAPTGVMGLLLAGLFAAFIGTFAGTLNAAQAYLVNDIYLKYVNPKASNQTVSRMNYITGIVVVALSVVLGFFAKDVNTLLNWIVAGLYGGYISANMLKWYWWRFNSSGFFWGMLAGIVSALTFPYVFAGTLDLYYFPLLFLISLAGSIIGTYAAPATDMETLKDFYMNVRPWGFWKPIAAQVQADYPAIKENKNFWLDMFNVVIGVAGQMCLTVMPIYLVLGMYTELMFSGALLLVCGIILKKTWWDRLPNDKPGFATTLKKTLVSTHS
ncbi:sodium:solute symporter family protein [Pontibacter sp. SGAir0037]|uniref:sodium:solute symporter family protein n=1 Tax=Pontibacter sp. SGAir0037 TaxID=2571030 RepID=UPI0010CCD233|nr:sodium:solute symporter family protein [Pontibacter sp. SGAir0037]QCR22126.1 sodium:solute symporter [Pontibacter sp. SGAir0037]